MRPPDTLTRRQLAFLHDILAAPRPLPADRWPSPIIFRRWFQNDAFRRALAELRDACRARADLQLARAAAHAAACLDARFADDARDGCATAPRDLLRTLHLSHARERFESAQPAPLPFLPNHPNYRPPPSTADLDELADLLAPPFPAGPDPQPAIDHGTPRADKLRSRTLWNFVYVCESNTNMRTLPLLLLPLLLCGHHCVAEQPDARPIAVGEWSDPVSDSDRHTLRGRLVVQSPGPADHAPVYLELEHLFKGSWTSTVEVYHDVGRTALNLELRDGHDQPVPQTPMNIGAPMPQPNWIILPCDATVRVRGDLYHLTTNPRPDGLEILLASGNWVIPSNAAGDFYLSGTFTPPADHPSVLKYDIWHGTLKLPRVKIPSAKAAKTG